MNWWLCVLLLCVAQSHPLSHRQVWLNDWLMLHLFFFTNLKGINQMESLWRGWNLQKVCVGACICEQACMWRSRSTAHERLQLYLNCRHQKDQDNGFLVSRKYCASKYFGSSHAARLFSQTVGVDTGGGYREDVDCGAAERWAPAGWPTKEEP